MDDFDNRTEFDKEVDTVKINNEQAKYVYGLMQELDKLEAKRIAYENDEMTEDERKINMKRRANYEEGSELYNKYNYVEIFTEEDELRVKDIKKELRALNPKFIDV